MNVEAAKDTADFGAGLCGIGGAVLQVRSGGQLLSDIAVAEAAQTVIAVHDAVKKFDITAGWDKFIGRPPCVAQGEGAPRHVGGGRPR